MKCPHCNDEDKRMFELLKEFEKGYLYLCNTCSKTFVVKK